MLPDLWGDPETAIRGGFPKRLNSPISVRFEPQWPHIGACVVMGGAQA
jgi:hypothetical protein